MSQDQRGVNRETADPSMLKVVNVRSTDAHRRDSDQDLIRTRNWVGPIQDLQISGGSQDTDPHGTAHPSLAARRSPHPLRGASFT